MLSSQAEGHERRNWPSWVTINWERIKCGSGMLAKWAPMNHRTPLLDVELNIPHLKPGWDKNGFSERVNIYFLQSVDLFWMQDRCQPEYRGLVFRSQWVVVPSSSKTKEAWKVWGMRTRKSYLWPHLCPGSMSCSRAVITIWPQIEFSVGSCFSPAIDQWHHL